MPVSSTATLISTRGWSTSSIAAPGLTSAWMRVMPFGTACPEARIGRSGSIDATWGSAARAARAAGPIDAANPETAL